MKVMKPTYEYTCDVCGKPIDPYELGITSIPKVPVEGNGDEKWEEWHFHVGSDNSSCNIKFISAINKFFTGMEVDVETLY